MAATQPEAKLKVVDLNPYLSCILCGGYFIDATTITECLHSFCRACIVRYLETSKYCPVCEVQVHKTRPLRCIRSDRILQDIVYKMVPGLYQNEMLRRRELYASQPPEALKESRDEEDRGEGLENRYIYTEDEVFCIALTYRLNDVMLESGVDVEDHENVPQRRFLRCPAAMKMNHLKKFIRMKYAIPKLFQVALQFEEELLKDDYSLMDVAYISSWRRNGPIQLTFRILEKPKTLSKPVLNDLISAVAAESGSKQKSSSLPDAEVPSENGLAVDENPGNDQSVNPEVCDGGAPASPVESATLTEKSSNPEGTLSDVVTSAEEQSSTETPGSARKKRSREKEQDVEPPKETSIEVPRDRETGTLEKGAPAARAEKPEEAEPPPPKVPKLTIPLTPKILQMAAQHAEDDKMELDNDLFEGRLVIAEPEMSPKDSEDDLPSKDPVKAIRDDDFEDVKKDSDLMDDDEVDSGRGSDSSSRAEARSLFGDEEVDSPESGTVCTPDSERPSVFELPSSLPSPTKNALEVKAVKPPTSDDLPKASGTSTTPSVSAPKDDFGVLDLSLCHRKRGEDRLPVSRPKQVANPPVLDKFRQTTPCLPMPDHPSFKNMFPSMLSHPGIYKKPEYPRGNFRFNRSSILTVINPDPNSCRPKIVIKNLDPRPEHRHHNHHHHHHHHHHGHHHQKM